MPRIRRALGELDHHIARSMPVRRSRNMWSSPELSYRFNTGAEASVRWYGGAWLVPMACPSSGHTEPGKRSILTWSHSRQNEQKS